ncbi:MAG: hypothetical protein AAGK21_17145, partial [Bacteroidota bacterium]
LALFRCVTATGAQLMVPAGVLCAAGLMGISGCAASSTIPSSREALSSHPTPASPVAASPVARGAVGALVGGVVGAAVGVLTQSACAETSPFSDRCVAEGSTGIGRPLLFGLGGVAAGGAVGAVLPLGRSTRDRGRIPPPPAVQAVRVQGAVSRRRLSGPDGGWLHVAELGFTPAGPCAVTAYYHTRQLAQIEGASTYDAYDTAYGIGGAPFEVSDVSTCGTESATYSRQHPFWSSLVDDFYPIAATGVGACVAEGTLTRLRLTGSRLSDDGSLLAVEQDGAPVILEQSETACAWQEAIASCPAGEIVTGLDIGSDATGRIVEVGPVCAPPPEPAPSPAGGR